MAALALPAVFLIGLAALLLAAQFNWRTSLLALAGQYVGVFLLVALSWPIEMAAAKLIAGVLSAAVLGMGVLGAPGTDSGSPTASAGAESRLSSQLFRLLSAVLVLLTILSLSPRVADWIPGVRQEQIWGGLILIGMGLLQLGFTDRPFETILALLTALAGFEILYAVVELSALVAGLLAAIDLGLALIGAYLLAVDTIEETG